MWNCYSFCEFFVRGHFFVKYGLDKSAFSTYSFKKSGSCLLVFYVFHLFCFEFHVIFVDFLNHVCIIIAYVGTKYSVILFSTRSF